MEAGNDNPEFRVDAGLRASINRCLDLEKSFVKNISIYTKMLNKIGGPADDASFAATMPADDASVAVTISL